MSKWGSMFHSSPRASMRNTAVSLDQIRSCYISFSHTRLTSNSSQLESP